MKIALIAIYDHDAFSIRTLHSLLHKHGYDVRTYFLKRDLAIEGQYSEITKKEYSLLMDAVKDFAPKLIGMSLRSTLFHIVSNLTLMLKQEMDTHIIWGGVHPTLQPEECLKYADSVCIGEGEGAMLDLAESLSDGTDYSNIKNLCVKSNGKIIRNSLRPLIRNLDSIPFPDASDDNKYYIVKNKMHLKRPGKVAIYEIMTMRGCPFNCTYCSTAELKKLYSSEKGYIRQRSVKNVIEELENVLRYYSGIRKIYFYDSIFTIDKAWIKEFCKEYKQKIDIPFFCYPHPRLTDEEMFVMLKDAGLRHVKIGIQSGSDKIRNKIYKRAESTESILRLANMMHKYKMPTVYDLISANPFEEEQDMSDTLELLLKLPKPFQVFVHKLCFYPSSAITSMALEKGVISKEDVAGNSNRIFFQGMLPSDVMDNKMHLFWSNLYYLAGKVYVPNKIIRIFSRSRLLRKYPESMAWFIDLMHKLYLGVMKLFDLL